MASTVLILTKAARPLSQCFPSTAVTTLLLVASLYYYYSYVKITTFNTGPLNLCILDMVIQHVTRITIRFRRYATMNVGRSPLGNCPRTCAPPDKRLPRIRPPGLVTNPDNRPPFSSIICALAQVFLIMN